MKQSSPVMRWHSTTSAVRRARSATFWSWPGFGRLFLAGIGVGICSSVIPYVCDQLAMARLPRATFALLLSLLPATAAVIGVVVLRQIPTPAEVAGVSLIVCAVALHQQA